MQPAPGSQVQTKESQTAMTPQQALAELKAGNARFVAGTAAAPRFSGTSSGDGFGSISVRRGLELS